MRSFTATSAKNAFGRTLAAVDRDGTATVTRHDGPRDVVMSIDRHDGLVASESRALDALSNEFDALLERMRSPRARRAMKRAFAATSARIGNAAVKAAKPPRNG